MSCFRAAIRIRPLLRTASPLKDSTVFCRGMEIQPLFSTRPHEASGPADGLAVAQLAIAARDLASEFGAASAPLAALGPTRYGPAAARSHQKAMMAIPTNSWIKEKPRRSLRAAFTQDMAKS